MSTFVYSEQWRREREREKRATKIAQKMAGISGVGLEIFMGCSTWARFHI